MRLRGSFAAMMTGTILIAEADAQQRDLYDVLFAVDGSSVTVVASGSEALAHLREHTPAAVVVATDLPDVSGSTICQKVKAVSRLARVPVVLVAPRPGDGAALDDAVRSEARRAGADLLIQKPLGDKNLRERVQRLIATARDDTGLTPAAVFNTGFLQIEAPATAARPPDAAELQAEVDRLRDENTQLRSRLTEYKAKLAETRQELEEERARPRGLFGRRG